MTELGELVSVNLIDASEDDKCPFCYEAKHDFPSAKKKSSDKVKSIPKDLSVEVARRNEGDYPYTTAMHHLISALQCYGRLRRLVRMGSMIDYDINNPNNGIGLPTTHWRLKYNYAGFKQKFGDFTDINQKRHISFTLMNELKAQWHVGHHAFDVETPNNWDVWKEDGSNESSGEDRGHLVSYDTSIIIKLLAMMDSWISGGFCKDDEDNSDKLKADMDQLSSDIKDKLDMFGQNTPWKSSPLFVSRFAYEFAVQEEESNVSDPLPGPSKKKRKRS